MLGMPIIHRSPNYPVIGILLNQARFVHNSIMDNTTLFHI